MVPMILFEDIFFVQHIDDKSFDKGADLPSLPAPQLWIGRCIGVERPKPSVERTHLPGGQLHVGRKTWVFLVDISWRT